MSEVSYLRHVGKISYTWETAGDVYGPFLNYCRISAWRVAINRNRLPTDRILDFGCANGSWSDNWRDLGFRERIGIDINPEAVVSAQSRMEAAHVGDAATLAAFGERLVGCNGVVVHILEESEVRRVFQSAAACVGSAGGGHFVVSVINPDFYVTANGFKPWMGPLSCTRPLEFHEQCATDAGFEIVDRVGTFVNPWFCQETVFIANDAELKADQSLFDAFAVFSDAMRARGEIRPFSELLLVCRKL